VAGEDMIIRPLIGRCMVGFFRRGACHIFRVLVVGTVIATESFSSCLVVDRDAKFFGGLLNVLCVALVLRI
jgi:hypothetical protein